MNQNIHITRIPQGEKEVLRMENIFEKVMTENFLNMVREKSTEGPNQDEPKDAHSKAQHN